MQHHSVYLTFDLVLVSFLGYILALIRCRKLILGRGIGIGV